MLTSRITARTLFALPVLAAAALSTPAHAAKNEPRIAPRQAMAICDRNPNCHYIFAGGGIEIFVGQNHITCSLNANQCWCVDCGHKRTPGKSRPTGTVGGVLTSTPATPSKPAIGTYQPPPGAGILDNTTGFNHGRPAATGTPIGVPRGGNVIK